MARMSLKDRLKEGAGFAVLAELTGGPGFSFEPIERFLEAYRQAASGGQGAFRRASISPAITLPQSPGGVANIEPGSVISVMQAKGLLEGLDVVPARHLQGHERRRHRQLAHEPAEDGRSQRAGADGRQAGQGTGGLRAGVARPAAADQADQPGRVHPGQAAIAGRRAPVLRRGGRLAVQVLRSVADAAVLQNGEEDRLRRRVPHHPGRLGLAKVARTVHVHARERPECAGARQRVPAQHADAGPASHARHQAARLLRQRRAAGQGQLRAG